MPPAQPRRAVESPVSLDPFIQAGRAASRWFQQSQVRMQKPYWDANHGRFFYNRYINGGPSVPGSNWTQGRGIFVLLSDWELTGNVEAYRTAIIAGDYLRALQVYDVAEDPFQQFALREWFPSHRWTAPRDATEAVLALMGLYRATGKEEYLRRAVDFARWFEAHALDSSGWPWGIIDLETQKKRGRGYSFQAACAPLFYFLAQATGNKKYLRMVRHLADLTLRRYVRPDGAIVCAATASQHTNEEGIVVNDDGLMVSLLGAHIALGEKKYLEACRKHAAWVLANIHQPPAMYSALPCLCNFMLQWADFSGDAAARDWAVEMLRRHVLPLQVHKAADPLVDGAFRGEDENTAYYGPMKKGVPGTAFVTTRVTCYAALACFKLAGIMGPYYGASGWDRPLRRPPRTLPALLPSI